MKNEDKEKTKNFYYKKGFREIYSKTLTAGNRRYYFDTNETNAGDYYLSITESKKLFLNDGKFIFRKHKIFIYKEDFKEFKKILSDMIKFIINKKGKEVISDLNKNKYLNNKEEEVEYKKEEDKKEEEEEDKKEEEVEDKKEEEEEDKKEEEEEDK